MIKTVLTMAFISVSITAYSQSNNVDNNNQSDKLKRELKIQHLKTKTSAYEKTSENQTKSSYNNWERQILDAMTVSEIPKDFPKYSPEMTDEQYKATIISWANANPTFFKQ